VLSVCSVVIRSDLTHSRTEKPVGMNLCFLLSILILLGVISQTTIGWLSLFFYPRHGGAFGVRWHDTAFLRPGTTGLLRIFGCGLCPRLIDRRRAASNEKRRRAAALRKGSVI
jgi:hypothetical protein